MVPLTPLTRYHSATDHRLRPPRLRPLPRLRTAAATAAHRLPAPLAARAQPAAASRHFGHMDPTVTHPLFSDAVGVVFRCWVPTSRCRARLTLRSPPTRTRRALFGRHAAADGLRRIISSLAGCLRPPGANSILHSARMILSDVLTCTVPPLRVESSLLKNPIPPKVTVYFASTTRLKGHLQPAAKRGS